MRIKGGRRQDTDGRRTRQQIGNTKTKRAMNPNAHKKNEHRPKNRERRQSTLCRAASKPTTGAKYRTSLSQVSNGRPGGVHRKRKQK